MTEQKRAAVEYTQEELETMVKAVLNGAPSGTYATSLRICWNHCIALDITCTRPATTKTPKPSFPGCACTITTIPVSGWGSPEAVRPTASIRKPVDAYGLCSAMGALASPVPLLQAGMCYLKMGDREKAQGAFVVALSMGEEGNPEHDAARGKASAMLAILEQAEK